MTFFHYTSVVHLPLILNDGFIKAVESNVDPTRQHAGPDVVWLLDDSDPQAFRHGLEYPTSMARFDPPDKRRVRFEVDVPAIRWLDWYPASLMPQWWRTTFITAAGGPEATEHWYVWPKAIKRERWVGLTIDGKPIAAAITPGADTL